MERREASLRGAFSNVFTSNTSDRNSGQELVVLRPMGNIC